MITNDVTEREILTVLSTHVQLTSGQFFQFFPEILSGGQPAKNFGRKINNLAKMKCIATKKTGAFNRLWQITDNGRLFIIAN